MGRNSSTDSRKCFARKRSKTPPNRRRKATASSRPRNETRRTFSLQEKPMPQPRSELSRLEPFVGAWNTSGTLPVDSGPALEIRGTDTYAWLAGGHFLVHRADVLMGGQRSETLELIGFDADTGAFFMRFFDSEGETGSMRASNEGSRWTFEGEALRFDGGFSDDLKTFSGAWKKREGEAWVPLMEIRLDRA